jgi:outer membrane immunogenic protein
MRRWLLASIAGVSAVTFTQIASAADLPRKAPAAPPPPPVYSWTGFYVGANIGGGWGKRDVDYVANDPLIASFFATTGPALPMSFTSSGVVGGVQLGYNWQFNRNWLVGLETDFDGSGIKGSSSASGHLNLQGGGSTYTMTADERVKWFGTVRARLGYLPTDTLLLYATGGFAYGNVEHTGAYNNLGPIGVTVSGPAPFALNCLAATTCYAGSSSKTAGGWTVGGGLEYAFAPKWTLKGEYLYVSLDGQSVIESALPNSSFTANFGRTNFNVARAGVNYRF